MSRRTSLLLISLGLLLSGLGLITTAVLPDSRQSSVVGSRPSAQLTTMPVSTPPTTEAIPAVPPSLPRRLVIPAIGLDVPVEPVVSTASAGEWAIRPPEDTAAQLQSSYWWSEQQYSALPGSPSAGTTFIYGHACLKTLCAFNHLFQVKQGDQVQIDTDTGAIAYRITTGPIDVEKSAKGIGADGEIYKYGVSNRLVLITCGYGADGSSTYNVAVIAEVVTATPS